MDQNTSSTPDEVPLIMQDANEMINESNSEQAKEEFTNAKLVESEERRKNRIRSIRIVNIVSFTFAISFSIVFTGVFPYLKELMPGKPEEEMLSNYGIVVAIMPIGQLIFSPIFGKMSDSLKSIRPTCLVMAVIFVGSSVLYATISDISSDPNTRFYLLLVSRFLAGAFAANLGPIRGYVSEATFKSERTKEIAILYACQSTGFSLGPLFQAAFGMLGCSELASIGSRYFSIESYNVCGWVTAIMGLINATLFLPGIFNEYRVINYREKSNIEENETKEDDKENLEAALIENKNQTVNIVEEKPKYFAIFLCMVSYSIYAFNFVFLEALGTPICMEQFGWSQKDTVTNFGLLIGANGVGSIFYYYILNRISKRIDERKLLICVGISTLIVGRLFFIPLPWSPFPPTIPRMHNNTSLPTSNSYHSSFSPSGIFNIGDSREHWIDSVTQNMNDNIPIPQNYIASNELALNKHKMDEIFFWRPYTNIAKNVACENVSGPPGCNLKWCSYIPALTVTQFVLGWVFTNIGFAFSVPTTIAVVSKMYGDRQQGLFMSMTVVLGGLSRAMGPFLASYLYRSYGTYCAVGISLATLLIALVMTMSVYKQMKPLTISSQMK